MSQVRFIRQPMQLFRQAVDHAFNLFPLELQGKKILIKPNVLRASQAKEGVITHLPCFELWWKK